MLPAHLIPALATAADRAINRVLATGATAFGQKVPTGEVGFAAAAVLGGVPALALAWEPILKPHGYAVAIQGVFCHQSPYVEFVDASGEERRCELADLLLVVDDLTTGIPGRRWAVLIQAKMANDRGGKTLSGQSDLNQVDLLSRWPLFTMPAGFSPGDRDLSTCSHAGALTDCGRYGLIIGPPNPVWNQPAPALAMPAGGDQLGTFLARMMETGQTGYGREATGLADDWSKTVDELLRVTASSVFNYATGFKGQQSRGSPSPAFAFIEANEPARYGMAWSENPPPSSGRPEQPLSDGPSEGISMLRIGLVRSKG